MAFRFPQALFRGPCLQDAQHALRGIHGAHSMTRTRERQRQGARAAADVQNALPRQEPHALDEGQCIGGSITGRGEVVGALVPAYDRATDRYLELGDAISVKAALYKEACDLTDEIRLRE
jgi:hypothetical protein